MLLVRGRSRRSPECRVGRAPSSPPVGSGPVVAFSRLLLWLLETYTLPRLLPCGIHPPTAAAAVASVVVVDAPVGRRSTSAAAVSAAGHHHLMLSARRSHLPGAAVRVVGRDRSPVLEITAALGPGTLLLLLLRILALLWRARARASPCSVLQHGRRRRTGRRGRNGSRGSFLSTGSRPSGLGSRGCCCCCGSGGGAGGARWPSRASGAHRPSRAGDTTDLSGDNVNRLLLLLLLSLRSYCWTR